MVSLYHIHVRLYLFVRPSIHYGGLLEAQDDNERDSGSTNYDLYSVAFDIPFMHLVYPNTTIIHVHQHYLLGIQVLTPDGLKVCRATLLLISVDLPAQSKMLNMKQYNGSYACNHCED